MHNNGDVVMDHCDDVTNHRIRTPSTVKPYTPWGRMAQSMEKYRL
jgi:hypothetical protein